MSQSLHPSPYAVPASYFALRAPKDRSEDKLTLRSHDDYLRLYGERALVHEPGAEYRYSNSGFVLLGLLIERVSGVSYYDYVRSNIFRPAGMQSTDSLPETQNVPNRVSGYTSRDGAWVSNTDTFRGEALLPGRLLDGGR